MNIIPAVFILLLIEPPEIHSQKHIHSDVIKDFNLQTKDYGIKVGAKISEDEIQHVIKSLGPHACRVKDPSKYCKSFRTCYECVSSMKYPCNWCHNFGCSYKGDNLCTVHKMDSYGMKNLSCPFISTKVPILIASGVGNHIAMKINVPDPALLKREIICQLNLNNNMIHSKGLIAKNMVYCFPPRLIIDSGREVGTLRLLWDGVEPYSNDISVYVYRCDLMATNCLDCRRLPLKYGCGWCESTRLCVSAEKCQDHFGWSFNKACQPNS